MPDSKTAVGQMLGTVLDQRDCSLLARILRVPAPASFGTNIALPMLPENAGERDG